MTFTTTKIVQRCVFLLTLCIVSGVTPVLASDDAGADARHTRVVDSDVASVLESSAAASVFTAAMVTSTIWQNIQQAKEVTLFVPTDAALRREGSAFLLEEVLVKPENAGRLDGLMAQHVVPGQSIVAGELQATTEFPDQHNGCLTLSPLHQATKVGPEAYVTSAVKATNGYVYFIDRLLWTPYNKYADCSAG